MAGDLNPSTWEARHLVRRLGLADVARFHRARRPDERGEQLLEREVCGGRERLYAARRRTPAGGRVDEGVDDVASHAGSGSSPKLVARVAFAAGRMSKACDAASLDEEPDHAFSSLRLSGTCTFAIGL
jgi:hypothetical protein